MNWVRTPAGSIKESDTPHTLGTNTDGSCNQTVIATTSYSYDTGDRLTGGTLYDGLGRTLQLPDTLLDGNGPLAATYYVNDLVATLTQNGETRTYTLDPAMRFATETDHTGATTGWRYANDSDSPAWHATPGGGWTRNVTGLAGDLAGILTYDGQDTRLTTTLTDLHGTVVMHIDADPTGGPPTPTTTLLTDEYGTPIAGSARYSWHGAKQRHTALPSGAILMGVRLYIPQLGRFLQVDPVLGGSATTYDYCNADPINCTDHDGKWARRLWNRARVGIRSGLRMADRYGTVGASTCVYWCVAATYQDRRLSIAAGGFGWKLRGPFVGFNTARVQNQGRHTLHACAAYKVGGCGFIGHRIENGRRVGNYYGVSVGPGVGGSFGTMTTVWTSRRLGRRSRR